MLLVEKYSYSNILGETRFERYYLMDDYKEAIDYKNAIESHPKEVGSHVVLKIVE